MVENGVYIIKEEYFKKFQELGSSFKDNKSGRRPTFCCIQDKYEKELFWLLEDLSHNYIKQVAKLCEA